MTGRPHNFKLNENGDPIPVDTSTPEGLLEWASWYEDAMKTDRESMRVAQTRVRDCHVSTVFLALDHGWGDVPMLFETLLFGGPLNGECARYSTREEALVGHARMVDLALEAKPFDLGRNRVWIRGFRLVRRYRWRGKRRHWNRQWVVFKDTSRERVATVFHVDGADKDEQWAIIRPGSFEVAAFGYVSQCIDQLAHALSREEAKKIIGWEDESEPPPTVQ